MRVEFNYSLERYNSFRLPVKARRFLEYDNEDELTCLINDDKNHHTEFLSIGEGSNLLFISDFKGVIFHSHIKGITVKADMPDSVLLRIGAAEHWDDVVAYAVTNGWSGIENLSAIPGTAGAAAIQNIGAYGVEIKDVIETVEAINQLTGKKYFFSNKDCRYGYRHSFFKETNNNSFIITAILLRLQKKPHFKLDYGNLKEALSYRGVELQTKNVYDDKSSKREITIQVVRDTVMEVRRSKLPDPAVLGNAGSFFTNPVIPQSHFIDLKSRYSTIPFYPETENSRSTISCCPESENSRATISCCPESENSRSTIPFYPEPGNCVKIPAGWLIEQCGFKGKREGNVGVYEKQALIIVNHGGATGLEIAVFAEKIRQAVFDKFGIRLVPEVKYV